MPRYIDADALYEKIYPLDLADKRRYAINAQVVADAINNAPTADVVPWDEAGMHGQSYYFMLDQAIESSGRFIAERESALAKKIFEEIESVLFTVARPCPSADGTIITKQSKDFHIRREDYYTIKEKYTKGGAKDE